MKTSPSSQKLERIIGQVRLLAEVFGRRLSDEAVLTWARTLERFNAERLTEAFKRASVAEQWPTLGELVRGLSERRERAEIESPQHVSAGDRARANRAALKSMLWLHHACGWTMQEIGAMEIAKAYQNQTGKDPVAEMQKHIGEWSPDELDKYMIEYGEVR